MENDKTLSRLARAYPEALKADQGRAKPRYGVSNPSSVLDHLDDVASNTMSKAIMLAVMLDQFDSGEAKVDKAVHERAAGAFEEVFRELAHLQMDRVHPVQTGRENMAFVVTERLDGNFDAEQAQQALEALNGTRKDD